MFRKKVSEVYQAKKNEYDLGLWEQNLVRAEKVRAHLVSVRLIKDERVDDARKAPPAYTKAESKG
jgi:hypothetical protein